MDFLFICGWCGEENAVYCEPVMSWWSQKYRAPDTFFCWLCSGESTSPPGPWTPADD